MSPATSAVTAQREPELVGRPLSSLAQLRHRAGNRPRAIGRSYTSTATLVGSGCFRGRIDNRIISVLDAYLS